jgi:putative phage-type endonuclease
MEIGKRLFEFTNCELVGDFVNGSPEWHAARKGSLGGSQIGAILGLNPWESPYTAWLKVTGQIPSEIKTSMAMRLGTKFETPILEIFAEDNPGVVFTTGTYRSLSHPWQHANPDAIHLAPDGRLSVVEVKYSGDYWSEPPRHYVAQINWYMYVLGLDRAVIVALAGSAYKEFWFERNDFEIEAMLERVNEFWDCVTSLKRPEFDGSESTYQSVREMNRGIDDEIVELGFGGVKLLEAKARFDEAQSEFRLAQSVILDGMGSAKYGEIEGVRVLSRQLSSSGVPFIKFVKGK